MLIEDDYEEYLVTVVETPEDKLTIENVVYDANPDIEEPFTISYTCVNHTGNIKACYGYIVDNTTGKVFNKSYWVQDIVQDYMVENLVENGLTKDMDLSIKVGFV